jgi:AP-3 complex subunit delta-1
MDKIIQICSQNDYQHITNFDWYITVLVELTRMEGGTKHGVLIASQLMDVAIRVSSIRPFAVNQMALLIENHVMLIGSSSRNSTSCEVLYAASWICGEFSEHLSAPDETLKALYKSKATNSLPGHILSVYLQNGMKLFSFIAEKWLKEDNIDGVKELATFLEEKVLKDLVASIDLEVQERASVMYQFVKYVGRHIEKSDDISEDFKVFFADDLNPVASKAQKKVPIPEGLDLDAWINEPPTEEESSEESSDGGLYSQQSSRSSRKKDAFGVKNADYESPARKSYVEPTKEELRKRRDARLAQQSSDPFYLKESNPRSPLRSGVNVDDIPVQNIDLGGLSLQIPGLATTDQYMDIKNNGKKSKKGKRSKKHKDGGYDGAEEEEEHAQPSVFVSKNAEMPEGVDMSDNDDDDGDKRANDDPHRALGEINLDEIEVNTPYVSKVSKEVLKVDSNVPVELFGGSGKAKKKKKEKEKEKDKKPKKKEKKKKSKKEHPEEIVTNGNGNDNNGSDDMDFWLSDQPSKVAPKVEQVIPEEKSKKKHKKKSSKRHNSSKDESDQTTNGISQPFAMMLLAENTSLKLSYDVKIVPMDPDKVTAGISFVNVGTKAISSIEMDFIDTQNIKPIREEIDKGIKIEMNLEPGQLEVHLFLFKVIFLGAIMCGFIQTLRNYIHTMYPLHCYLGPIMFPLPMALFFNT